MKITFTKHVGFLFLLPLVATLAVTGFLYDLFVQMGVGVHYAYLASGQHVRSEHLGAYAHMVYELDESKDRPFLRNQVAVYDREVAILEKGGQVRGHNIMPAPLDVQDEIAEVKRLWNDLRPALTAVADLPVKDPRAQKAYAVVRLNIPLLAAASSQVVTAFDEWHHSLWERMFSVLIVVAGLNFALLISGVWIIRRYIAERHEAEKVLRESEARFRDLYDQAPVGYHECGTEGRITRVNRSLATMLGYSSEEMVGLHAWKFIVEGEMSQQKVIAKLAGEESPEAYERTWRRKDGTVFSALMKDILIRDAERKVTVIRTVVQDITERKQVEAALLRAERTRVLLEAAGAAAHEVSQPLTVVMGMAQLLLMDADSLNDRQRDDIGKIRQAGQKICEIVSKMQNLQEYINKPYVGEMSIVDLERGRGDWRDEQP